MKISKLLIVLSSLALSLSVLPAFANEVAGIADNDHAALIKYYEKHAHEEEDLLHEDEKLLEEYEEHPFYFGGGQDTQSHTLANIHQHEKTIEKDLLHAEDHKKMMIQKDSSTD
ncbi:hypothetical protein C8R34_1336 [Nitrosomonas sp. Nm84]|uniref:hypothetical protein n=1 Tax=Nitrosomonas sp. Nm84 TaxID=200124 RepID=UPI000D75E256|nr:hypothetical protein [Nitrosomonas sp. Nm84]PXW82281.1 hypothetical protein C8R34_1336 [Nitrosomonas sp. Nm84]